MREALNNEEQKTGSGIKKSPGAVKAAAWEMVKFFILAILIVLPIRIYIAQPFIVNGSSMDPTFATGEYLIVDELSYRLGSPERGDVVILRYPRDPSKFFIKRIIGLPNETIQISGGSITIKGERDPTGFELKEPYIKFTKNDDLLRKLGDDEYFVMGDNRAASSDSRAWGPVEEDLIIGRALLRLFPIASAKVLPGKYKDAD
ncbi:MAG: signal peptidase I [Patescibacteria group bacterium]|nr:MAG: signal peptidase I [Patescibacteria group bacterium]